MKIKITKKTHTMLNLQRLNPQGNGWNVQNLEGLYIIDVSDEVKEELVRRGADLDDPLSIESIVRDLL